MEMSSGNKEYLRGALEIGSNGQLFVRGNLSKLDVQRNVRKDLNYFDRLSNLLNSNYLEKTPMTSEDGWGAKLDGEMVPRRFRNISNKNVNSVSEGSLDQQSNAEEAKHDKLFTVEHVTADELKRFGWSEAAITDGMLLDLNQTLEVYNINTPHRKAHFMAQVFVESDFGQSAVEYGGKEYFTNMYEGRKDLGNIEEGDGEKFRGAGYLQVTGRANYQALANRLNDPKIVELGYQYVATNYPWRAAGDWWDMNNMNTLVDNGYTVSQISGKVNTGDILAVANHLKERESAFELAKKIWHY